MNRFAHELTSLGIVDDSLQMQRPGQLSLGRNGFLGLKILKTLLDQSTKTRWSVKSKLRIEVMLLLGFFATLPYDQVLRKLEVNEALPPSNIGVLVRNIYRIIPSTIVIC